MTTKHDLYNQKLADMGVPATLPPAAPANTINESVAVIAANSGIGQGASIARTAALAALVYQSGAPSSKRKEALDKLIRSGLAHEDALDAVLDRVGAATSDPEMAKLAARYPNNTFNTRQLIKLLGVDATFMLAASSCHPEIGAALLAGYALSGGWLSWIGDLGVNSWQLSLTIREAAKHVFGTDGLNVVASVHPAYAEAMAVVAGSSPSAAAAMASVVAPAVLSVAVGEASAPTITTTTTPESTTPMSNANPTAVNLRSIPAPLKAAIEAMIGNSGAPGVTIDGLASVLDTSDANSKALVDLRDASRKEMDELMQQLRIAKQAQPMAMSMQAHHGVVTIPSGKMDMVDAETLFPEMKGLALKVPAWTWDAPHPDVPARVDGYIFRRPLLLRALRCLARGENLWLQGHTGSGKTTFVEQIASVLGWPVLRIALDAAIDRAELVGRMQLKPDGKGGTASEWLPGALERALPHAYILLLDEIDAGHPNSLYTLQPVLEGKGLTLLEDGGRVVPFHPMTRLVATGNTAGSGDESGLYPACRILSAATLDRFPEFIEVPYLSTEEEEKLIRKSAGSKAAVARKLAKFASEMREAFVKGELPVSYSPRRSIAFARAVEDYLALLPAGSSLETACDVALAGKLMQATPNEHRPRLTEIARTCLGTSGAVPDTL